MDSFEATPSDELPRPVDDDLSPGTALAGGWRIVELLGRGGISAVYLGEHGERGRVAIKVLHAEPSQRAAIARRFHLEAGKAGSLGHPHIVEVLDAGELPDGRLFLVMEHLTGHDLAHELEEVLVFDVERACALMRQVALALAAVHTAGIVHRDLKPSNVMLVPQPGGGAVVKLIDFGLAATVAVNAGASENPTEAGAHTSSADYMAPEQATSAAPSPAFDVYAVGVMLYEMLTGALPFTARHTLELLTFKLLHPAPSIDARRPGLPPLLVRLIADCLSIDPTARPADGEALASRLDEVLADLHLPQPSLDRGAVALAGPPAATPRRSLLRPVALVAGLALAGAAVFLYESPETPMEAEPAELGPPVQEPPPEPVDAEPPVNLPAPPPAPAPKRPEHQHKKRPAGEADTAANSSAGGSAASASEEHLTPRCQRVRSRADEARRAQQWSLLRDQSRHRECWASDVDARKLQTKAAMELNDFPGCLSMGAGLKDPEVQEWLKLCKMRSDE